MVTTESKNKLPDVYKSWSLVGKNTFSLSKITQWLSKTIQSIINKKKDEPKIDEDFSEWEKSFAEEIAIQKEICKKYNATHIDKIGKSTLYYIRTTKGEYVVSLHTTIVWPVEKIEIPSYYNLKNDWYIGTGHLIVKLTNKEKKFWIDIYKGQVIILTNVNYDNIYDIPHEEWYYRTNNGKYVGDYENRSAEIIDKKGRKQSETYREIQRDWKLIIATKFIGTNPHIHDSYELVLLIKNDKGFFSEVSKWAEYKEKIWEDSIILRYKNNIYRRYDSQGIIKLERTWYFNNPYNKQYQTCNIQQHDGQKICKVIFQGEILPIENISEDRYRNYTNIHNEYDNQTYAEKNKDLFIVQNRKVKKVIDGEVQEPIEGEDFMLIYEWKYRFYGQNSWIKGDSIYESGVLTDSNNMLIPWEFIVYKKIYMMKTTWYEDSSTNPIKYYLVNNNLEPISEEFSSLEYKAEIEAFIWKNTDKKVIVAIDGRNVTEYHDHFVVRNQHIKKWVLLAGEKWMNDCYLSTYNNAQQYIYSTNFDLLAWPVKNIEINNYTATITRNDWSIYDIFLDGTPLQKNNY